MPFNERRMDIPVRPLQTVRRRMDIPVRPHRSVIVGQECPTYGQQLFIEFRNLTSDR